jgi:hypothetical protein
MIWRISTPITGQQSADSSTLTSTSSDLGETMSTFDINQISDEAIRTDFRHLERRANLIAKSLVEGYGPGRKPIEFRFINESEFNAYARFDTANDQHLVEINAAVPLFTMILFYRLLSDNRVLHYLDPAGAVASDFDLPFVIDHENFERRVDWKIEANSIRAFAAGTIADICNTFVILHEFAHVICGHVDAMQYYEGKAKVAEFASRRKQPKADKDRRLAWEAEADMIAAGFLVQYIGDLVEVTKTDLRAKQVFGHVQGYEWEHTLAIVVASLFGFFCYVEGTRRALHQHGDHPHPQVRSLAIKDFLLQAAEQRVAIDGEPFSIALDARLSEMMDVSYELGLFDPKQFTTAYSDGIDSQLEALRSLVEEFQDSCFGCRWFDTA